MSPAFTLGDPEQEHRLLRWRIVLAGLLMLAIFLAIMVRIFHLQVLQHDHFTTLSQSNRVKIVPIPPTRGLIFSSDGVLLADNRSSFSLELTPEHIEDLDGTIDRLREFVEIDAASINRFRNRLGKNRRFESIPLQFNLSDEEVARISVNLYRFPGVDVKARLNRYYPLGANLAHTVGYVGMIDERELATLDRSNYSATSHIGKIGVEKAYEDLLHGKVGHQQVEVNAQGRVIRVLDRTPPVPGENIYLSLDVSLQNIAMDALGERRGAIVAMDPRDGSILAMASSPSYDPNLFVNGIDSPTYRALLSSSGTPLLNRGLQGTYPPGSTIKPILAFAALQHGIRENDAETWCPGWYQLKGSSHRYRDWKKEGHGHTDLRKAIVESCDVYFYSLAQDLGIERIHEGLAQFGLGQKTGIDIGGESSGLVPSREWKRRALGQPWYPGETLIAGIGQGSTLVTPLQLAVATSAIANRGHVIKPHIVDEARDALSNKKLLDSGREVIHRVRQTESEDWEEIIGAMHDVVQGERGTARASGRGANYQFAGKTGTAQVISIGQDEEYDEDIIPEILRDHALFIAFAPLESPRIAIAIIVENGGSGSSTAAPIARQLFDHYLNTEESVARE
ncbi:MAG: penicillin-binding protein 2 [Gammaproteobacteria bacterium]